MTVVILAAGMGRRFGGLKQTEEVDGFGHAIFDYSLTDALMAGFDTSVFIIRREMREGLLSTIATRRWFKEMRVRLVFQEIDSLPCALELARKRKKPWGTAHAIACLDGTVKEPFAIMNADDLYGREAVFELADLLKRGENCTVAYQLANTLSQYGSVCRGVCKIEGGFLKDIEERLGIVRGQKAILDKEGRALPEGTPVSMNLWGLDPCIIEECRRVFPLFIKENVEKSPDSCELFLPTVISRMIGEGRLNIRVKITSSVWQGITYREDKAELMKSLQAMVEKGIYPPRL